MARRILIFCSVYYPRFVGGAEVAVKEITDRIPPAEIEFDMITLRMDSALPKAERIGNISIHRIGWTGKMKSQGLPWYLHLNKYAYVPLAVFKALSLHRKRKYQAIWSIMASYNSFAAIIFKTLKPAVKLFLTLQEGDPTEHMEKRAKPLWPLFKRLFTRADRIQAISSFLALWAKKMGARCPIDIVPNAVDLGLFAKNVSEQEIETLKDKLDKRNGDIFLITTSRLEKKNAIGDVIDALTFLPKNVKFLILGKGSEEVMLKEKCAQLKLEDRVIFMGYVPHKDMPKFLRISDIFVRPSLSEGLGNSFLEAMAGRIPVIATPVGGIPDFLIDGETGLFCEPVNPRSIAQKVEKLIKDEQSREYIVERAFDMVEKRYRWEGVTEKMKGIMLDL